jgi:hypothetical protein
MPGLRGGVQLEPAGPRGAMSWRKPVPPARIHPDPQVERDLERVRALQRRACYRYSLGPFGFKTDHPGSSTCSLCDGVLDVTIQTAVPEYDPGQGLAQRSLLRYDWPDGKDKGK